MAGTAVKKALGGDKLAGRQGAERRGAVPPLDGRSATWKARSSLTLVRPDKMRRSEEMGMGGMVGGPTVERVIAFNGTEAWDDIQNRGGMGGGMQMVIGGSGGPGVPAAGRPVDRRADRTKQRMRRMRMELQRWTVALLRR